MAKPKKKQRVLTIEEKRAVIGAMLMNEREAKGLSLKDLEAKVQIPGAVLCRIEHGENKLSLENAVTLTDFFGLDITTFAEIVR
jgi:ribosome-binding protein aMBF1 (putative translation factor)